MAGQRVSLGRRRTNRRMTGTLQITFVPRDNRRTDTWPKSVSFTSQWAACVEGREGKAEIEREQRINVDKRTLPPDESVAMLQGWEVRRALGRNGNKFSHALGSIRERVLRRVGERRNDYTRGLKAENATDVKATLSMKCLPNPQYLLDYR